MKTDWPPLDAGLEIIIPHIYGKPLQWADAILERTAAAGIPRYDDHDQWDNYDPIDIFAQLAQKLGFPFNPAQHEQPTQIGKMFPLPIHSDQSDCETEIIVSRGLYVIWTVRSEELGESLTPGEALRQLQVMGEKLVHYFGSINRVWRECQAEQVKEWTIWLRCTHGGYDLASGALTDDGREVAAMREFDMNGGAA